MGRTKSYEEEEVLNLALNCFWDNGYQNTSIRLLEQEMGINQFSIYSSFKSKSHLYQIVLRSYMEKLEHSYLRSLKEPNCNIADIEQFLINFGTDMITKKIPHSCLMVRSILNYNNFDEGIKSTIDDFISTMVKLYSRALKNSISQGLLKEKTIIRNEVNYLMGITQSISIINQHMNTKQLKGYVKNSISKLK